MKKNKILDQVLHFAWSALALAPIVFMNDKVMGGALSGLLLGAPRELIDQWPVGHWGDTILDLVFFTLGGAFIGYMSLGVI
ncbi:unnamed protein product [marine sediment metagenome]|uniref:VanZ-like domain-containing protein n=1 Tax=marine sediment metagenome TaxID=412755 RepID=X0VLU2_9ZZZZ